MNVLYSDQEVIFSGPESPRKNRKSVFLIRVLIATTLATLISVIVLGAFMIFSHHKLVNHLVESQQSPKAFDSREKSNRLNSSVYFFGGADEELDFLSTGVHFNSATRQWRNISNLPFPVAKMCGAVADGKIYLFGGHTDHMNNLDQSNKAFVYDGSTDTYKSLRSMPEPRGACGAALLDDYIYVAGGSTGTNVGNLISKSSVIRYSIKTGQWSTVHSMNTPRDVFHLVTLDGHLYAIGGRDLNSVEEYDPSSDQWSFMASPKTDLTLFDAAVHKGKIYVINLYGFEVYSPDTDEWSVLSKPDDYRFANLFSMNGLLWAVGKYDSYKVGNPGKVVKRFFSYDPATKKWNKQQKLSDTRFGHATFVINH